VNLLVHERCWLSDIGPLKLCTALKWNS